MAHPQIAAFARLANGSTPPVRVIAGQATKLGRNTHDIRYDSVHDEILVGNSIAQSLLIFRGGAAGDEAPLRTVQGPHTQLQLTERAEVDPIHNEIFALGNESVLVFSRTADGDAAPLRVIQGPDTLLRDARALAEDPVHNLIVVSVNDLPRGEGESGPKSGLVMFNRTDSGNVKPRAVIAGPHTGFALIYIHGTPFFSVNMIQSYPPRGWIVVTQSAIEPEDNFIGVWSVDDNGDVPPRWKIGGPRSALKRVRGVALNPEQKEIIAEDVNLNAILTYSFPELF